MIQNQTVCCNSPSPEHGVPLFRHLLHHVPDVPHDDPDHEHTLNGDDDQVDAVHRVAALDRDLKRGNGVSRQ